MERARAALIAIREGGDASEVLAEALARDPKVIAGLAIFIAAALAGVVLDPENL